jgi:hypothetical protein
MDSITLTRAQLETWSRPLTDREVEALEDAIPHSSIPESISVIVDHLDSEVYETRANALVPGMIFREYGDEWLRVMERDDHGDTVLLVTHDKVERSLDFETVVEVIRA